MLSESLPLQFQWCSQYGDLNSCSCSVTQRFAVRYFFHFQAESRTDKNAFFHCKLLSKGFHRNRKLAKCYWHPCIYAHIIKSPFIWYNYWARMNKLDTYKILNRMQLLAEEEKQHSKLNLVCFWTSVTGPGYATCGQQMVGTQKLSTDLDLGQPTWNPQYFQPMSNGGLIWFGLV
jgi:hypothetical protein